jgi:pilus assembly protein CpaE
MPEKTIAVKLNIKNREAALDLEEAVLSVPGFCINSNGTPCDIMVVEIGNDLDEELKLVEHIRAKGLAREVFLTSSSKDPEVLLKALKTGVREFFPQPLNKEEVTASLAKFQRNIKAEGSEKAKEKKGILISVIGSKGGVGATTTAVNLAVSLQQMAAEKSVALMDMNPLLGAVNIFLDIKNSFSWAEGARDIARMDSTYLFNTLYKHPTGIHVLPAPSKPLGLEAATPDTMERLVGHMRSAFDITVMDGCKSFDDLSLRMLALSNTILVVSELNILSVINAKRLLETFDGLGLSYGKDIKVVINRYQKKNMVSPGEAEKTLGRKIVSLIPNDYETTMSAINTGKTLSDMALKSAVMENFRELAALLLHKEVPKKEKSRFPLNFMGKK